MRPLEKGSSVVDVDRHPRILIGTIGIEPAPERIDTGIDLDGVHVFRTVSQRDRNVRAAARADD